MAITSNDSRNNKKSKLWNLRVTVIVNFLVCLCLCFSSCTYLYELQQINCPKNQPDTQWISEDGDVFLYTDDTKNKLGYWTTGYIIINDVEFPIQLGYALNYLELPIFGFTSSRESTPIAYDFWKADEFQKDSFNVTVKSSPFFPEGKQIRFRKLKDNEKIDYTPFWKTADSAEFENPIYKNAEIIIPVMRDCVTNTDSIDDWVLYYSQRIAIGLAYSGINEIQNAYVEESNDGLLHLSVDTIDERKFTVLFDQNKDKISGVYSATDTDTNLYPDSLK